MPYILDENSLSIEDFFNLVENEETLDFSEKLIEKITFSSNLLKTYEKKIESFLLYPIYKSYESCDLLSQKEVKSILLSLIYTLANSSSGVSKETIDELCQYLNRQILIPELALSQKINSQTPYYLIVQSLKNIKNIEKKIILQSPGYLVGIVCIYFFEIELIRKLLTLISIFTSQLKYIDPYNLAYSPLLPFIKLSENINLFSDKSSEPYINSEIFVYLSEVYKSTTDLKEILNIQLNSSQFPIIFIPENNTYVYNVLLNSHKIYLAHYIEDLLTKIDNVFLKLLSTFKMNNSTHLIDHTINKLKNNLIGEPILKLRDKIKVYKEILSTTLYILSKPENKESKISNIIEEFFRQKNISNNLEIKYYLKEFLYFLESETNELF